jgi:hypothetical protein
MIIAGSALFLAGVLVGAFGYALVGADSFSIDPQVQNALVLAVGAVITSLVAAVGVYWAAIIAGDVAASEGAATRKEARRLALIDQKINLVRRIGVLGSRHAREVAIQVARRQELAGKPYEPLPRVNETTAIEDAVNDLYAMGFQATADVAQLFLGALYGLDMYCYVATDQSAQVPIAGLTNEERLSFETWELVQRRVKTHMIDASLTDEGTDRLAPAGTLLPDYWEQLWNDAYAELATPMRMSAIRQPPEQQ